MKRALLLLGLVAGMAVPSVAGVMSVTVTGGDVLTNNYNALIEPESDGVGAEGTYFQEDAWCFVNRTHEYNGPRFTAAGLLKFGTTYAADDIIVGVPAYLVGASYISTWNEDRDNATYTMTITVDNEFPSYVFYLLIDNRRGDNVNTDPPTLGSGGTGAMPWVADEGWAMVNTGISPNGQPDYVAVDEGATPTAGDWIHNRRTHGTTNLGVGPGMHTQNASTVYMKQLDLTGDTGSMILKEFNETGRNMYGVVVVGIPEPATLALMGLGLGGLLLRRKR